MQNILFGLSPSFTNSLQLIPRWRFVVAAFPHVMHCAAAMLQHRSAAFPSKPRTLPLTLRLFFFYPRKESSFNLGTAETKLLYTLHWVILDAADECSLQVIVTESETSPCTQKVETTSHSFYYARLNLTASWRRQHSPTCFHSLPSR